MRIINTAELPRVPWKNGGGETTEIAVHPPGAGFDTFDWRISMATVATDGPFSIFPGIDRTLAILDGAGIQLVIAGEPPVTLTAASPPLAFPADLAAAATLISGTTVDLNVMSRRGVNGHTVERRTIDHPVTLDASGITIVFCQTGDLSIAAGTTRHALSSKDAAILELNNMPCTLTSGQQAIAFIIRISGLPRAAPQRGSPR
jgi:uncharacterized protein